MLVFLGVYSAVLCTATSLELTFSRGVCALVMLLAAILFYGLFTVLETFRNGKIYGILGITLFFAMIIFYFWDGILQKGLVMIINAFLVRFMSYTGTKLTLLYSGGYGNGFYGGYGGYTNSFCTSFVLVLIGVYLIVIISAYFYRRRRPMVFLALTTPFAALPMVVGRLGYFSNLFTYLIVVVAVIGSRHQKTDATDRRMRQKLTILLILTGLVSGAVSYLYMPPQRYDKKKDDITQMKNSLVALSSWDSEDVFSWLKSHFNGDAIDYGGLGDRQEVTYTGETMLKLSGTVNNAHSLYLKGYVGDRYEDNNWTSLQEDPEYQSDLEALERQGLTLDNWHANLYKEMGEPAKTSDWAMDTIRIRNVAFGYGNYVVPYFPTDAFMTKENGRSTIEVPGIDYTVQYFLVYPNIVRSDLLQGTFAFSGDAYWSEKWINDAPKRDKVKEFAQKYYLQVPESLKGVCDDFKRYCGFDHQDEGSPDISNVLKLVELYITKDTEYTLSPGKTPSGRDTIEYFLNESKKGYCTYYASAAAILLRSMGIPTRYVEGMYVSREELTAATEKNVEILVPDSAAHAWIEVFNENYGFVMMEVTPGRDEDESGTSGGGSNNSQSKDPGPDDTDKPKEEPEMVTPTPAATQTPQEDMIFDDIDGNEEDEEAEPGMAADGASGASESSGGPWKIVVEIVIILVFIIVVMEGERRIRRYLFLSSLQRLRMKRRIRMVHHHLMPLFNARGAAYRGQPLAQYARLIAEGMGMRPDQITEYVSLVYHARFGPDDITEVQLADFRMIYDQIRRKAYADAKPLKKLYYMYIMVL